MTGTDNTSPRLCRELIAASARLEMIVGRIPMAVMRLDAEQPGWPSGLSGSGSPVAGPDRWRTSDPAFVGLQALLDAHSKTVEAVLELDRTVARWALRQKPGQRDRNPHELEGYCSSCLRVGSMNPRRSQGGDTCRWCQDTLRAVNHHRRTLTLGADLVELPVGAVRHHAEGRRTTDHHIDVWARTETKGKR